MDNTNSAIELLSSLIVTPSISREEVATATLIDGWLQNRGLPTVRIKNNILVLPRNFDSSKPTLLLNSHHDTVKPSPSYNRDPFNPSISDGRIYGLGSNDAGASVVSLMHVFPNHYNLDHKYNLIIAITAEEEVGGENGIRAVLPELDRLGFPIDMALVGEPTSLQPAVGERGLIVLDCVAHGKTGHAARNEGVNAIYEAIDDIQTLRNFQFPKKSQLLGDIKISVTQIQAGTQHNVIPDECRFVVDVRTTDAYSNEETARMIADAIHSEATPRSTRVWPSAIDSNHPLVATAVRLGGKPFVSPTTSDMSLLHDIPSLKIGPGDSARSHMADEWVYIREITDAIDYYNNFLNLLDETLD